MRATYSNFIEAAHERREDDWRLDCMMQDAAPALAGAQGKTVQELSASIHALGGFSIPEAIEAAQEHFRLNRRG